VWENEEILQIGDGKISWSFASSDCCSQVLVGISSASILNHLANELSVTCLQFLDLAYSN
jgi:hypothetical protein